MRIDAPSIRVRKAMARISRDKWISPDEVELIGFALARLAAPARPHHVIKAAIPYTCFAVGMIRGLPPSTPSDPNYTGYLDVAQRFRRRMAEWRVPVEMYFLKLKENELWKQRKTSAKNLQNASRYPATGN